uniref:Transmembrane protein 26a n=1 Tax=Tetraodon nigroviridis TaxID=99883 RepID=H3CPV4_TETNG
LNLLRFSRAVVTRALFILLALACVWRVKWVKKDPTYWLLTCLLLPLVIEMVITLRKREGHDYKWFSPPIFLFLLSIIPSIWLLELHQQDSDSDMMLLAQNTTEANQTYPDSVKLVWGQGSSQEVARGWVPSGLTSVCSDDWILALHQVLLILLILGKWLLPLGGGVTRDELSQLLLIFVGIAADILEFTCETLSDTKDSSPQLVYIILAVWTWSMLQFPLHLAVVNNKPGSEAEEAPQDQSLLCIHSTDIWSVAEALFIQDGPFLVVRLVVLTYYKIFHQMLLFFAMKNFLVVILNLYRLV